jgi:hypothetical protein
LNFQLLKAKKAYKQPMLQALNKKYTDSSIKTRRQLRRVFLSGNHYCIL